MNDEALADAKQLGLLEAAKVICEEEYGISWHKLRPVQRDRFIRVADKAVTAATVASFAAAAKPYEEDVLAKRYWEVRWLFRLADAITNVAIVIHDAGLRLGRTLRGH
jgi:hypothetical protein